MKIALLSTFFPYRGGIAQFSGSLWKAMSAAHDVRCWNFKRQYPAFLFPGETQFVKEGDTAEPIVTVRLLDSINPFTYRRTARAINAFQPEVFISSYWMTFFGPALGTVAKNLHPGIKKIAILHNVVPHEKRFFDKAANRFFLKHHDGFVVLSDAVERDLRDLKPGARILRIDHPVYDHFGEKMDKAKAREQLNLSPERKTILFFGIIRDYKGLDLLIDAVSRLDDTYQLVIAGESYGPFEKYAQQIETAGLKDRVPVFNRYISDQEVSAFFSAADVCVLPYRHATQSGITAISHHFNVPLIATDVGGLKETIRHGETGLIVDAPSPELLSDALVRYFSGDNQQRFSARLEAKQKESSWANFASSILLFASELP